MKTLLTVDSKRQFYIANIVGLAIVIGLTIWFFNLSLNENGVDFKSLFFWLALVLLVIVPFALISIFSAMKSVIVTSKGLIISYSFKNHKSVIDFPDIKEFKSSTGVQSSGNGFRQLRDSFRLILADGRVFEFSRSQFNNYDKLKTIIHKAVARRQA
jgi:hypothetical protein